MEVPTKEGGPGGKLVALEGPEGGPTGKSAALEGPSKDTEGNLA